MEQARSGFGLWIVGLVAAAMITLVLVLELGGGAPQPPPAGLPDPGRVPAWALAVLPLAAWFVAVVTVGFALVGSGLLVPPPLAALGVVAAAAAMWITVSFVEIGVLTWQLNGQTPLLDSWRARGLLAQIALAALTCLVAAVGKDSRLGALALPLAVAAVVPTHLTGHVRTAALPLLAGTAVAMHVVAASLWIGGLAALGWLVVANRQTWATSLRRYSRVALVCVVALAVSGTVATTTRLDRPAQLVTSAYGAVIALKAVLLIGLIAIGQLHRRHVVARARPTAAVFAVLAGAELIIMAVVTALAVGLAQTPHPSEHEPEISAERRHTAPTLGPRDRSLTSRPRSSTRADIAPP